MKRDNVMKIAIATMTGENYGSALQAYALQHSFAELGVDTCIIRYVNKNMIRRKLSRIKRLLRNNPNYRFRRIWSDIKNKEKNKKINAFYNSHLHMLEVNNLDKIEYLFEPQAYVCGSDQIWNPQFQPNSLFYLDLGKRNIKRYSYACSLAVDELSIEQETYYKEKLSDFLGVSVREKTGQNLLREVLRDKDVRTDIDPVLLYDAEKWKGLESKKYSDDRFILLYMLRPTEELIRFAEWFSGIIEEKVIYLGDYYYNSPRIIFSGNDGVEDFLSAIIHADFVITNSFHATAFSVLFEKKFGSMVIERTGSRVRDFLKMVNLEDRIIDEKTTVEDLLNEPNYTKARTVLKIKRKASLQYLNTIKEMNPV